MDLQILAAGPRSLIACQRAEPIAGKALRQRLAMPCRKELHAVLPFQRTWERNGAYASTAGTRFQRNLQPESEAALSRYDSRLLGVLEIPPILLPDTRNALDPRALKFDREAAKRWLAFADDIEERLAPGKALEPVRSLANKLPEHVARIAAVLTVVDDPSASTIRREAVDRAIAIADYYTTEALRLFEAGLCSPELRQAEKLLHWLRNSWGEPLISLRAVYRLGPNSIREAATAKKAVAILEEHGWLLRLEGGHVVAGESVREEWRVVREG